MSSARSPERRWQIEQSLGPALLALGAAFALFEFTSLDLAIQDRLFDFQRGVWLVDGRDPTGRAVFYTAPKFALIIGGVIALMAVALPWRRGGRRWLGRQKRSAGVVFVLTLGSVPALIGWGKSLTNVFCPSEIRRYGGDAPYVRVLERYPTGDRPERCGRCFPAGHASGGFALLSLAAFARTRRGQVLGLATGAIVGGAMGFYQMGKGAHFLSHTVVTAFIAWIVFCLWLLALQRFAPPVRDDRAADLVA